MELLASGVKTMLKILQVHLAIWLLKLCADRIIQFKLITLLWELWLTNACLEGDLTLENQEKRLETIFCPNRSKSSVKTFLEGGQ